MRSTGGDDHIVQYRRLKATTPDFIAEGIGMGKAIFSCVLISVLVGCTYTTKDGTTVTWPAGLSSSGSESPSKSKTSGCGDTTRPASGSPTTDTDSSPKPIAGAMLPEFHGIYISGGKLTALQLVPVTTRFGLMVGGQSNRGMAVDGFAGSPPQVTMESNPTFIVYMQGVDISKIRLSSLVCTDNLEAYQFNLLNTNPSFFHNVYQKNYHDTVKVDLWQAKGIIEFRVAPVSGKTDMYRLVPVSSLVPGKYALYFGDELHQHDIVFTASVGRQASAYYFEARRGTGPQPTTAPPASQSSSPALPLAPTKDIISRVQVELKARGFDAGPPDGSIGSKTREALRRFQNAHRLRGTGEIDTATLEALGIR